MENRKISQYTMFQRILSARAHYQLPCATATESIGGAKSQCFFGVIYVNHTKTFRISTVKKSNLFPIIKYVLGLRGHILMKIPVPGYLEIKTINLVYYSGLQTNGNISEISTHMLINFCLLHSSTIQLQYALVPVHLFYLLLYTSYSTSVIKV